MPSTIEKAKIAKLLILADLGEVSKFQGKTLNDIETEDSIIMSNAADSEKEEDVEDDDMVMVEKQTRLEHSASKYDGSMALYSTKDDDEWLPSGDTDEDYVFPIKKRKIVQSKGKEGKVRQKWSTDETEVCTTLFKGFLLKKTLPGKDNIIQMKKGTALERMPWRRVKDKLHYMMQGKN